MSRAILALVTLVVCVVVAVKVHNAFSSYADALNKRINTITHELDHR